MNRLMYTHQGPTQSTKSLTHSMLDLRDMGLEPFTFGQKVVDRARPAPELPVDLDFQQLDRMQVVFIATSQVKHHQAIGKSGFMVDAYSGKVAERQGAKRLAHRSIVRPGRLPRP